MERHTVKRILYLIQWAVVAGLAAYFINAKYYAQPYLSYPEPVFQTVEKVVHPGEVLHLKLRRCNSDTVAHIYPLSRKLVGPSTSVVLPILSVAIEPGCHPMEISGLQTIPLSDEAGPTKPGTYHIEGFGQVVGEVNTWNVHWRSVDFKVEAAK